MQYIICMLTPAQQRREQDKKDKATTLLETNSRE
jgi:hypothetical protein